MKLHIKPLRKYAPLFAGLNGNFKVPKFIAIPSPRHSYKSTHLAQCALAHYEAFQNLDVIIGVDADTNAGEGLYAEIQSYILEKGLNKDNQWEFKNKRIYRKDQQNQIRVYVVQTSKKDDINKTKGDKTLRPASLILFDETQKLWGLSQLMQALSTFGRQTNKSGYSLIVISGNKERGYNHWFNKWINGLEDDPEWEIINVNYLDAPAWITPTMLKIINTLKKNDYDEYSYMFLGTTTALSFNIVFPQFNRQIHWLGREDCPKNKFEDLVIGIDHATTNDALGGVPTALLDDGKMLVLERLFDSPKWTGSIKAPSEQALLFRDYLVYLDNKYGLVANQINICLSIDCAASGFIAQIRLLQETDSKYWKLWNLITIYEFSKKDKERNIGIIRDAFRNNLAHILKDDDGHQFHLRRNNEKVETDELILELESQVYNNNHELEKRIPNDMTDALEYSLVPLLINCYDVYFPNQKYKYNEKTGYIEEIENEL